MKYKKRPIVIEAVRLSDEDSLPTWFIDGINDNIIRLFGDGTCEIKTRQGILVSFDKDYIIKGVNGEIYPCDSDIFESTYDIYEVDGIQMDLLKDDGKICF